MYCSLLQYFFIFFFVYYFKKTLGEVRVSVVYTTKTFIIWKYQLTLGFLVDISWKIFNRAKCNIILFIKFSLLIFLVQKMSWWSDRDVSVIPACTTFSLLFDKIWSMRTEVLHVAPVRTLISCFNSMFEQNWTYSKVIWTNRDLSFTSVNVFSNKFTPFYKIFIFISPSMNISFPSTSKESRISVNSYKKSISDTYRYGHGVWKEQIHKCGFDFFGKNIFFSFFLFLQFW